MAHDNGGKPWVYREAKPFGQGNTDAAKHGAYSDQLVSAGAQELLGQLLETLPWLHEADALTLDGLCRAKWRHDRVDQEIEGIITGEIRAHPRKGFPDTGVQAVPERLWQQVSREARSIVEFCGKLGMTPVDRAALMKDTSWAHALNGGRGPQLGEQGRALREARGRAVGE